MALFSYCLSFPTSSHKACKTETKETRDFVVVVDLFKIKAANFTYSENYGHILVVSPLLLNEKKRQKERKRERRRKNKHIPTITKERIPYQNVSVCVCE